MGLPRMIVAEGRRPVGMEAAQLLALDHWLKNSGAKRVRAEARGMRMQPWLWCVRAGTQPFSEVMIHDGIRSLGYLISKPVHYEDAADLFCLDLYKDFDVDELAAMGGPSTIFYENEPKRLRSKTEPSLLQITGPTDPS